MMRRRHRPMGRETPNEIGPGDLVFCYGEGVIAWGIRTAEKFHRTWDRTSLRDAALYDHVAVIDRALPDGDWALIQALPAGVVNHSDTRVSRLSDYEHYRVVSCPGDRDLTVAFARSQVGHQYGFVTVVSFVLTLFSPHFINVMLPRTWICSALAGESLRYGTWLYDWPDIYQVTPAQLWAALEATHEETHDAHA